jgi:hypothetical protein
MEAERDGRFELAAVWGLVAVVAVEILVTYWRVPWPELYHVTGSGASGGFSRAILFLNFPAALVAIGILLYLLDGAAGEVEHGLALVAIALCAAILWPKIVDQGKLDARPVNAIAAVGVGIAFALTVVRWRRAGSWAVGHVRGDRIRTAIAVVLVLLALPWEAADLGFSLDGVPVLGRIFQTGALRSQPNVAGVHPAVHLGHHHGMDGTLLVLVVLLLSRVLGVVRSRTLRGILGAYLALMLCYGVGNIANDAWLEQITKRGWTNWEWPDVTTPKVTPAWGLILLGAAGVWLLLVLPGLRRDGQAARSTTATP